MSIGIHPLIKVFSSGEEVGYGVCMARDMVEVVVKVLKEFHPSGLATRDFLWLAKVL